MPDTSVQAPEQNGSTRSLKFRESMPRPLMLGFLGVVAGGLGLIVWLMLKPPNPALLALELRRSPPVGTFTHDVVRAQPAPVPTPLPATSLSCDAIEGVVIEGGPPALSRVGGVLENMCGPLTEPGAPVEAERAFRALARARIRFATFTRTGDQSTLDLSTGRILLSVSLARTNVDPRDIAPLLAHEGWHLANGGPVTAAQEFKARLVELQVCELFDVSTRGCLDARAIIRLGEARAVELLVRAGFPR